MDNITSLQAYRATANQAEVDLREVYNYNIALALKYGPKRQPQVVCAKSKVNR